MTYIFRIICGERGSIMIDLHCHTLLSDGSLGIEDIIAQAKRTIKWLDGKPTKKVIVVPGKIINIVL